MTGTRHFVYVAALAIFHAGLLGWSATQHTPVLDETGHLPAGLSHWHLRRFDLYNVNPPLVRMIATLPACLSQEPIDFENYQTLPTTRSEFKIGANWSNDHPERLMPVFIHARWACIPFSLLGAVICYLWGKDLYGRACGYFAMILWSVSPSVLGHASLITPDAGSAALGCTAGYIFWKWNRLPNTSTALLAGVILGLTLLTKLTWLILLPLWPAWWIVWKVKASRSRETPPCLSDSNDVRFRGTGVRENTIPGGRQLLLIFVVGWWVFNSGYLWEDTFQRLGEFEFFSAALSETSATTADTESGNRFRGTILANVRFPGPRNLLQGIDYIKYEYETGGSSYLHGFMKHRGWWYYYLYAMLVKMPSGTLLLLGISAVMFATSVWHRSQIRDPAAHLTDELFLLAPAVCVIALVSSQTGFNHHLRYVLPAFPFLFIFASRAALLLSSRRKAVIWMPAICLLATISSSLATYPHGLSYFNEPSGGPLNGWKHLDKSNVDWGQDLLLVKQWTDQHPEAGPLYVAGYSIISPESFGISAADPVPLPEQVRKVDRADRTQWPPGWYILSLTRMVDPAEAVHDFLDKEPDDYIGYSMRIYHVP